MSRQFKGGHRVANMTDYDFEYANARLEVPEHFNYTVDVVDRWAAKEPDRRALIAVAQDGSSTTYTFQEISDAASRAASLFTSLGITRGDRVFVQLPRIADWYAVMLGCFKIGAVPCPGTTQLVSGDIEYRINAARAVAAVVSEEAVPKVEAIRDKCPTLTSCITTDTPHEGWIAFADADGHPTEIEPADTRSSDPLLLFFTSGTTAHPKMVEHTHASLGIGHEATARYWHDLTPDDVHWTVSDFGWAKAGWGKLFGQWRVGATIFLWDPPPGKPDLDLMLRLIAEHRVSTFCAPPTIYRGLVQLPLADYDFSSLRHCTAAGEPLNPEVIRIWQDATGLLIYDGYGQTETTCLVGNFPCLPVKPGSMGKPVPGFVVEIVDDEGNPVGTDVEGHIAVKLDPRPVGLFQGYVDAPPGSSSPFHNGWYFTGDRGTKDADGYLWFVGRADDVIISAGYRIGPFEVESALLTHDAVVEAAVVAKPHAERGEIVTAFVVLAAGVEPSDELKRELQDHVKTVTAPYKYPREIYFAEELPKTVSGKIRRVELRQQLRGQ